MVVYNEPKLISIHNGDYTSKYSIKMDFRGHERIYKPKEGLILTFDHEEELIIENKKIIVKPVWKWLLE